MSFNFHIINLFLKHLSRHDNTCFFNFFALRSGSFTTWCCVDQSAESSWALLPVKLCRSAYLCWAPILCHCGQDTRVNKNTYRIKRCFRLSFRRRRRRRRFIGQIIGQSSISWTWFCAQDKDYIIKVRMILDSALNLEAKNASKKFGTFR